MIRRLYDVGKREQIYKTRNYGLFSVNYNTIDGHRSGTTSPKIDEHHY